MTVWEHDGMTVWEYDSSVVSMFKPCYIAHIHIWLNNAIKDILETV